VTACYKLALLYSTRFDHITSHTCSCACIAADSLSPVSMAVFIPINFNRPIASSTPNLQTSEREKNPTGVAPMYMYPVVFPLAFSPCNIGTTKQNHHSQ